MSFARLLDSAGLRAFRHRNYRLFYSGQLISLIGTWMQSVAQSWLILQLTGDPFYLGLVAAAQFIPVLLFGLFGGVIADAVPKRRTLIATQTTMMVLAFILFALTATGLVQVWMILILALLLGTANAVDMPVRQAFSVEMVGREDVPNAVALNSAMFNGARIVGPAVAGLTIAATSTAVAFLINGLTFLAVIVGLLLMRDSELRTPPVSNRPRTVRQVGSSLGEGLRYVRRTPLVLLAVVVVGLVATFGMNFNILIPAFAKEILGTGAEGYGFLMAAMGVGSLVAALWLAFGAGARPAIIVWGALLASVSEVVLAGVSSYAFALGLMFLVGFGAISMAASANTTIQIAVPDALRGRVMSVYTTVFAGSTPVGGLFIGWLASTLGVPMALAFGGLASLVVAVGGIVWLRTARPRVTPAGITSAAPAGTMPAAGIMPALDPLPAEPVVPAASAVLAEPGVPAEPVVLATSAVPAALPPAGGSPELARPR